MPFELYRNINIDEKINVKAVYGDHYYYNFLFIFSPWAEFMSVCFQ